MLLICLPRAFRLSKLEQATEELVSSRLGEFVNIRNLSDDDVTLFDQIADCQGLVISNTAPDPRVTWCIELFGQRHSPIFVTDGKNIGTFRYTPQPTT